MQNQAQREIDGISFEVSEEVLAKMRNSSDLHELIKENDGKDVRQ